MDFSLDAEQRMLQDSIGRFLSEYKRHLQPDTPIDALALWKSLVNDLGLGALVPVRGEEHAHVAHAIVMEALGHELVSVPFLESIIIAGHLLARIEGAKAAGLSELIACGESLTVLAWAEPDMRFDFKNIALNARRTGDDWVLDGTKCVVKAGGLASHFLVAARTSGSKGDAHGLSLFVVDRDAPGLRVEPYPTVDGGSAADLYFSNVRLEASALLGAQNNLISDLEFVRDVAIAALCAEAKGLLGDMLEQTRAYVCERRQFGKPLSSFQVLQHRLVDMHLHLVKATSASLLATLSLNQPTRSQAVASAQVVMASACRFIGQSAIQLHGGMGISDEIKISHSFKRATVVEREFGGRDFHLARYNALKLQKTC